MASQTGIEGREKVLAYQGDGNDSLLAVNNVQFAILLMNKDRTDAVLVGVAIFLPLFNRSADID